MTEAKNDNVESILSKEDTLNFNNRNKRLLVYGKDNKYLFIRDELMEYSNVLKSTYNMEKPDIKNGINLPIGYTRDNDVPVETWLCVESIILDDKIITSAVFDFGDVMYLLYKYAFPPNLRIFSPTKNNHPYMSADDLKFIIRSDYHRLTDDNKTIGDIIIYIICANKKDPKWSGYGEFLSNLPKNQILKFMEALKINMFNIIIS